MCSNLKIEELCQKPNIVISIKVRRLQWVDHLIVMEDTRIVNKIFIGKLEERRNRGLPKLRWLHCIEKDLQDIEVRILRKKAENRAEWAIILKETLTKL